MKNTLFSDQAYEFYCKKEREKIKDQQQEK
jgi:hypothetical protein